MKLFKKILSLGSKLLNSKKSSASTKKSDSRRARTKQEKQNRKSREDSKNLSSSKRKKNTERKKNEKRENKSARENKRESTRGRKQDSTRANLADPYFDSIKVRERKSAEEIPNTKSLEELADSVLEFSKLGLNPKVLSAISDMGYSTPTPVQKQAIPVILNGKDVIATAQTGTGKTAAFALPIAQMLDEQTEDCFGKAVVLVLSPTRELATQTAEAFDKFSKYADIKTVLIQGGVSMRPQIESIKRGAEVLIATPGRLLDLVRQRALSLKQIKWLVLDEVDRMFDMGFIEDVSNIIRYCPKTRQTLFFSATMPEAVLRLSKWALSEPEKLENGIASSPADTIEHFIYPVDSIQKYDMLIEVLKDAQFRRLIVFTRTRMDADRIGEWLQGHDYKVSTLHSDRSQRERDKALADFKNGDNSILVATDIASRGLDISDVDLVINYNVPEHAEDYVHRIGRTGRANREGMALTFFSSEETEFLRRIETLINAQIERRKLEGFAYRNEPILNESPKRRRRNR